MDDLRVLLADREQAFLRSTAQLLAEEGYVCDCVQSVHKAKDALSEYPFDLLIVNVNMPGNEALELIHEIHYRQEELPVILVADSPSIDSAVQSIALPVTAYLAKPLDLNEFLSKVKASLEHSRILRAVGNRRKEVFKWRDRLQELENFIRTTRVNGNSTAVADFQACTLQNITSSLLDLKRVNDALLLSRQDQTMHLAKFVAATREAIEVFEATKTAFKSKEIGAVRRRFERLLSEVDATSEG